MKVTDGMIKAFAEGWHAADTGDQPGGARRRAGLEAVLDMPEMRALERFARAAAALAIADGVDEWNYMLDIWNALPQNVVDMLLEPR